MKEITQAFMNVLIGMKLQEKTIKAIVQMLWNQPNKMDELVKFIKANPKATDSDIIRRAVEIDG